jgi:hypothetical protein
MPTFVSYRPFYYGSWDDAARAHNEVGFSERARAVMANFRADGHLTRPRPAKRSAS